MKSKKVTFGAKMEALTKNQFSELSKIKGGVGYTPVVVHLPTRVGPRECEKGYKWDAAKGRCVRIFAVAEKEKVKFSI